MKIVPTKDGKFRFERYPPRVKIGEFTMPKEIVTKVKTPDGKTCIITDYGNGCQTFFVEDIKDED